MATVVSEEKIVESKRKIYPWDEWLDGNKRLIVQGEDFQTTMKGFRNLAYTTAQKRGLGVVVDRANPTAWFVHAYKKS